MTIITTQSRVTYAGANSTGPYAIPFEWFLDTDISVVKTSSVGASAPLTLNNDYVLTGAGTPGGGTLNLTVMLKTGELLAAFLNPPINQGSHYISNAPFPSSTLENDIDRQTQISQRLNDLLTRSLRANDGDSATAVAGFALPPAAQRANTFATYDANGSPACATQLPVGSILSLSSIVALTGPQTPAEVVAGVVPVYGQYAELNPMRYGIDMTGATDSSAAIANLIAVAAQYNSVTIRWPQGGKVRIDSGMTWDSNKIAMDFQGSTVDFSHIITGNAMLLTNSNSDVNVRALLNTIHPIKNAIFLGPGATVTCTALFINDLSGSLNQAYVKGENLAFRGFTTDIVFGIGAFCSNFTHCTFTVNSVTPITAYSIVQQSVSNSGERNSFTDCAWFTKPFLIDNLGASTELHFYDCSFDYFIRSFNVVNGGVICVRGGHIEWDASTQDLLGYVAGTNGLIDIDGASLIAGGSVARTVTDVFYSDSTCVNGGVFLRNIIGGGSNNITTRLIGGVGNAKVENQRFQNGGWRASYGDACNLLAYGNFESGTVSNECTLSGSPAPSVSTAQAYAYSTWSSATAYVVGNIVTYSGSNYYCVTANTNNIPSAGVVWSFLELVGTHSLLFPGTTTSNTPQAVWSVACKPAQYMVGEFRYLVPAITGSSATFFGAINYVDAAGTSLLASTFMSVTANVATWTLQRFVMNLPAPRGTRSATLTVNVNNIVSSFAGAYMDKLIINAG